MIKYFLNNKISSYMLFSALLLFGIISIFRNSVSLLPSITYPTISVSIEYPGISPEKIEKIITNPTERIIKTVPNIKSISSTSEEGKSRINISFDYNTKIELAALKVREKIGLISDSFPLEAREPVVLRYDPSEKPVFIVSVENIAGEETNQSRNLFKLRDIIERRIKPQIQQIPGISEVTVVGGAPEEIRVNLDDLKFNSKFADISEIMQTISDNNFSTPIGQITDKNHTYNLIIDNKLESIDEIKKLAFSSPDNSSYFDLDTIANIFYSNKEKENSAHIDGENRIVIYIQKSTNANIVNVCNNIKKKISSIHNYEFNVIYDQSKYIEAAINNVITSALIGGLVVIFVLLFFVRNIQIIIPITLSIPLATIILFAPMYFLGIEMNIISLSGIALGAGLIVDNGIIVLNSIIPLKDSTADKYVASINSVKNAIISSTLTTIAVFIPMLFANYYIRQLYSGFAYTISFSLLISLCTSIFFVPTVYIQLNQNKHIERMNKTINNRFARLYSFINKKEEEIILMYKKAVHKLFNYSNQILILLCFIFLLFILILISIKFSPSSAFETNEFHMSLEFPTGTTLEHTEEITEKVEALLLLIPDINKVTSRIDKGHSSLTIEAEKSKNIKRIKESAKDQSNVLLKEYDGFAFVSENDSTAETEINISIIGNNNEILRSIAKDIATEIQTLPSVKESLLRFKGPRSEYHFKIDKESCADLAINSKTIVDFLRTTIFGSVTTKFIKVDHEVDVKVQYSPKYSNTIDQIKRYYVKAGGNTIPISQLIDIELKQGYTKIWHNNRQRSVTITATTEKFTKAIEEITNKLDNYNFPQNYYYKFSDTIQETISNQKKLVLSILLSVIIIYMILASLYQSLTVPFFVITTVPLSLIGSIISLKVFNIDFNLSVFIGIIILFGISVNNGIILTDSINKAYIEKKLSEKTIKNLIVSLCQKRYDTIKITTLTTVLGLFPMLFKTGEGSELWKPLSITVISGLIFSTLFTLIILPVILKIYYTYLLKN